LNVLTKTVAVSTSDGTTRLSRLEALYTNLLSRAAKGDDKAARLIFETLPWIVKEEATKGRNDEPTCDEPIGPADDDILAAHDREVLDKATRERGA
jgi:hypothetical protein